MLDVGVVVFILAVVVASLVQGSLGPPVLLASELSPLAIESAVAAGEVVGLGVVSEPSSSGPIILERRSVLDSIIGVLPVWLVAVSEGLSLVVLPGGVLLRVAELLLPGILFPEIVLVAWATLACLKLEAPLLSLLGVGSAIIFKELLLVRPLAFEAFQRIRSLEMLGRSGTSFALSLHQINKDLRFTGCW